MLPGENILRLLNFYRPPGVSNRNVGDVALMLLFTECVDSLFPRNGTLVLLGDFNMPSIDWSSNLTLHCSSVTCTGLLLELYFKHGLHQLIDFSTRGSNILDLLFTNDPNCICNVSPRDTFSSSDHDSLCFNLIYRNDRPSSNVSRSFYNFNRADWDGIRTHLSNFNFSVLFESCSSPAEVFDCFYSILYECLQLFVPCKTVKRNARPRVRYPRSIRRLQSKKVSAWREKCRTSSENSYSVYKKACAKCRSAIRSHVTESESRLVDHANLGTFYRYANRKLASKSTLGPLIDSIGNTIADPTSKANLLSDVFSSHFTIDNNTLPTSFPYSQSTSLSDIVFTPISVERIVKRLSIKTKGGPDGIPPIFIKNCIRELRAPLASLFEISFHSGYLPDVWRQAYITPIFKKGTKTDPNNYRPVALTATMCKIMESIIKSQLQNYFVSNNLFTSSQHAFLSKHSTATNLLECTNDWAVSLNNSFSTDIIYIDFSRAFDTIVFSKLLFKLQCYGVTGNLLTWISSFLHNRTQRVVVDYCFSFVKNVLSGVPQGSVLGTILFIIFINDINCAIMNLINLKLFADDAKLYTAITCDNSSSALQICLDVITNWTVIWQMTINVLKCIVLSICKPRSSHLLCKYFINGHEIVRSDSVRDLGITVTSNLQFNSHIDTIVSKARQRASVLFRGFISRNIQLLCKAYTIYIRPILEYNSIVWNPTQVHLIDALENVQRKFTKLIPSISHLSYYERLKSTGLDSLELRRLRSDLINYYKIIVQPFYPDLKKRFLFYEAPSSSRSNIPYLHKPIKRSVVLDSSFFNRAVAAWNSLPSNIKHANSLSDFKNAIMNVDLSRFLIGTCFK